MERTYFTRSLVSRCFCFSPIQPQRITSRLIFSRLCDSFMKYFVYKGSLLLIFVYSVWEQTVWGPCYKVTLNSLSFPTGIDFDEFLGMYKRLFLQCRVVVAGDVKDILSPTHRKTDLSSGLAAKVRSRIRFEEWVVMVCGKFICS